MQVTLRPSAQASSHAPTQMSPNIKDLTFLVPEVPCKHENARAQKMININDSYFPLAFSLHITTPLPSIRDV